MKCCGIVEMKSRVLNGHHYQQISLLIDELSSISSTLPLASTFHVIFNLYRQCFLSLFYYDSECPSSEIPSFLSMFLPSSSAAQLPKNYEIE
jgi:hypothetical protein